MRFKQNRLRSVATAKNFTIAMVLVNAAGFYAVQQKLKQAEVPDAYALDDGAQPVLARRDAILPDRRILPEVALTRVPAPLTPETLPSETLPAMKSLPVIDYATLDLDPVLPPEPKVAARSKAGIALATGKPTRTRSSRARPDVVVPSMQPAAVNEFRAAFDRGLEAPTEIGLTAPGAAIGVTVGPEATPPSAPPVAPDAEVSSPVPVDLTPPTGGLTAPRPDPSAAQFFPAAPTQDVPAETPAELPAAA